MRLAGCTFQGLMEMATIHYLLRRHFTQHLGQVTSCLFCYGLCWPCFKEVPGIGATLLATAWETGRCPSGAVDSHPRVGQICLVSLRGRMDESSRERQSLNLGGKTYLYFFFHHKL